MIDFTKEDLEIIENALLLESARLLELSQKLRSICDKDIWTVTEVKMKKVSHLAQVVKGLKND